MTPTLTPLEPRSAEVRDIGLGLRVSWADHVAAPEGAFAGVELNQVALYTVVPDGVLHARHGVAIVCGDCLCDVLPKADFVSHRGLIVGGDK